MTKMTQAEELEYWKSEYAALEHLWHEVEIGAEQTGKEIKELESDARAWREAATHHENKLHILENKHRALQELHRRLCRTQDIVERERGLAVEARNVMESMLCPPCTVIPCRAERAFVKDKNCHQHWHDFFAERATRAPEERIGVLGNQFRNDSRFIANARQDIPALLAVIAEQAAKIGLLQAAVEFYADAETWRQHVRETRKGRNSHWDLKPIKLDKGNRARAALTSIAEGEQKEE